MRLFSPKPTLTEEETSAGMRWLTWEGAASMGFGSITASGFLAAYALLMGANNFQIGILAALPFLLQPAQILMITVVERVRMRKLLAVSAWTLAQAVWIPVALIPVFIEIPSAMSVSALLGLVALRSLLAAATAANYNGWIRDLVPSRVLGGFFSRRLTLATVASIVFGLGASFFIDFWNTQNPGDAGVYGYTIAMLAGAIFIGMASPIFMALTPEPLMQTPVGGRPSLTDNLTMPLRDKNFRQLMNFLFFRGFTANLAIPFFAVYMLEKIGLSLTAVIALTVVSQVSNIMFLRVWGPMADRLGSKVVLSVCTSLLLLVILGWTFTTMPDRHALTIPLLVVLHIFAGVAIAGINVATGVIGMKLAPTGSAAPYLAGASLATNLGSGLAPLIGGRFADFFSVRAFSVSVGWIDPSRTVDLPAFHLTGYDFLFAVSFVLGLIALNTLATIREEGEASREAIMEELLAGSADMTRAVSSVPGIRFAAQFPYSYLRHIPGVDVAVGVTAYQLASSTRAAAAATERAEASAGAIARTVSHTVRDTTSSASDLGDAGAEIALHAARGVLHATSEAEENVETLARGALIGTAQALGRSASSPAQALSGAAQGVVRGAHEAGANLRRAVEGTLQGAREVSSRLGLSERESIQSVAESALAEAEELGPEAVAEVRNAISSAVDEPISRPEGD